MLAVVKLLLLLGTRQATRQVQKVSWLCGLLPGYEDSKCALQLCHYRLRHLCTRMLAGGDGVGPSG